ncbi:MAG: ABC transporter permease [Desulfovermiculus sp.]|nr:ABC transporter permease [Desulfovermiculus sp.]
MSAISPSFIIELTRRDYIERYAGSVLGSIWAFIWPLVPLFIYIVVFGQFMGGRLPGDSSVYSYSIYVSAGLIPWMCFSSCITRGCNIFLEKKDIISKVQVSLPSLFLFVHLSEIITLVITFGFFAVFLLIADYEFSRHLLFLPVVLYLQQILAFGLGLFAGTLTVFIRDLKEVVDITLQLWFWFTPLVYVADILPEIVKNLLIFNPAFIITESYHRIFVYNDYPAFSSLLVLTLIAHAIVFGAYLVFRVLEKDVRDFL